MVTIDYYDRDGSILTLMEWAGKNTPAYKRVASTTFADGCWVSTVWLGLNHNFDPDGAPLIFETMVFPSGQWDAIDCDRYTDEASALAGHARMVASHAAAHGGVAP